MRKTERFTLKPMASIPHTISIDILLITGNVLNTCFYTAIRKKFNPAVPRRLIADIKSSAIAGKLKTCRWCCKHGYVKPAGLAFLVDVSGKNTFYLFMNTYHFIQLFTVRYALLIQPLTLNINGWVVYKQ